MIERNVQIIRVRISEAARLAGRADLPKLIGVTKKRSLDEIRALLSAGVHHLAENRWPEWEQKRVEIDATADPSVSWHFVGGLQGRSLRRYYRPIYRLDSLDSIEHALLLSDLAERQETRQDVLLEINVTREDGRSGFHPETLDQGIGRLSSLRGLRIRGLMAMGPVPGPTGPGIETRRVFEEAHDLWVHLRKIWPFLEELSMGMSDDFEEGVRCGATEVRIGRLLFEEGSP